MDLDETHELFRQSVRSFVENEMMPRYDDWERDGIVPRSIFTDAGAHGFLGMAIPAEHGGGGTADFRYNAILGEELARAGIGGAGLGLTLHNDVCTPYFLEYCTSEQRDRWLPGIASGELITAIAMTEPGTGSDLAGISTTAVRDGDSYIVNGAKTFITNGINADLVVTAVKTDSTQRHGGMTLLVIERDMPGFERGRNLAKIGLHSQDTAELFFDDLRVPVANRLGDEGEGFRYLTFNLAQERLSIAVNGVAVARQAVRGTVEYVKERKAFGKPISSFQNTRFVLAELATEVEVAQAFLDRCIDRLNAGTIDPAEAAMAKLTCTQLQTSATDRCLQLFGGYGYMLEYPIARAYLDARVTTIYGGTSEVMKTIIARSIDL